jgi:hypothetical protein
MNRADARAFGAVLAFAVFAPRGANAMGAVVGPPDAPAAIASARVAVAVAEGRTTRWVQILPAASASSFAWLVPLQPGARVDLTTDAWLDALDAATVPVIVPPSVTPSCDVSLTPEVIAASTSAAPENPSQSGLYPDLASLSSFVSALGFEVGGDLVKELENAFSSGEEILALVYADTSAPVRALRIVDTGPATLPFALTANAVAPVDVTAFVVSGSAEQAGSSPLALSTGSVVWLPSGESNYLAVVSSLLASAGGSQWLDTSAVQSVFFHSTLVDGGLLLPSVLSRYYALASKYGDTSAAPDACMTAAAATEDGTSRYAAACPAGGLVTLVGPNPCAGSSGGTPVDPLVCGSVADAALAVATLTPSEVWVTRLTGIVTPASAADVALTSAGITSESPVVVASSFADPCGGASPDGGGWEVDAGWDDGGGDDGGALGDDGGFWAGGDSGLVSDTAAATDAATSLSDGCDSSSDNSAGGGCDGDSSSSDDSAGCGGSSSSDSADGCSGSNDCTTARHRHRTRSPVSRFVMMAAVGMAVLRRVRRRR